LSDNSKSLATGEIFEILIYNRPITNSEQNSIYQVMANRWGL
jgi:hypothetical protein